MSDTERRKFSVWDYFQKCDDDKFKAECLLCHKVLGCSTSHNLKNHLQRTHSDEVDVNTHIRKSYKRSYDVDATDTKELVRKAFTKVEGDKIAMCKLCNKILSYRSTIANLKQHLKKVHRDRYPSLLQLKTEHDDDNDEEYDETYYQVIEDEDDSTFYSQETESRDVKKQTSTHKLEDGEIYTEVIYLEQEPAPKPSIKKYNSKIKLKNSAIPPKRRMMSFNETLENQSSDEDLRSEQTPVSNELDKFGQYIATLLASMPKHVCTKLQMNIVNQIMEEKLKIETENANLSATTSNTVNRKNSDVQDYDYSQVEESDVQKSDRKYHKYIITENADIVKND